MPSLGPEYTYFSGATLRLAQLHRDLQGLDPKLQKVVAEIVHLRLYNLFENLISAIAAKLAAGASFLDGSSPQIVARARSVQGARTLFITHGRTKPKYQLRWSKASYIKDNVKHVISATDNYVLIVDRYGSFIDEIRRVRNRIAHNNSQSRFKYRHIVRRHYGAYMNHISPGTLLLSQRKSPCLLDQYIMKSRILAKDLVKG